MLARQRRYRRRPLPPGATDQLFERRGKPEPAGELDVLAGEVTERSGNGVGGRVDLEGEMDALNGAHGPMKTESIVFRITEPR